jgi:hypothetical protein
VTLPGGSYGIGCSSPDSGITSTRFRSRLIGPQEQKCVTGWSVMNLGTTPLLSICKSRGENT